MVFENSKREIEIETFQKAKSTKSKSTHMKQKIS